MNPSNHCRSAITAIAVLVLGFLLTGGNPLAAQSLPLAEDASIRVLVWNVSRQRFFDNPSDAVAVLEAADADVLILDELPDDRDASDLLAVLARIHSPNDVPWQVSYGRSGYRQRSAIAIRGAWTELPEFAHVAYAEGFADWMREQELSPERQAWIDADIDAGVAAHAVIGLVGGRRVLLVGVDLQCCGDSDDSWEERRRVAESLTIRAAVEQVLHGYQVDAILVGGDFNTTRGMAPVEAMRGDPARPESYLEVTHPRRADGSDWTWDGRGTPFPSNRFDYLLHSSELATRQALILDPEFMSEEELDNLSLRREQMRLLGDHLPIVVDLAWTGGR